MTMIQIMYSDKELVDEIMKRGLSDAVLAELKKIAIATIAEKRVEVEALFTKIEEIAEKYGETFNIDHDGVYSIVVRPQVPSRRWEPYPVGKWVDLRDNSVIIDYHKNVRSDAEALVSDISVRLRELGELSEASGLVVGLNSQTRAVYYPAAEGGGGWNRSDASC